MTAREAFGDSITRGVGASVIGTTNWVALLAAARGWSPMVNHGIDGAQAFDIADTVLATTVAADSYSTVAVGTNDERIYGVDSAKQTAFGAAHLAELVWLSVLPSRKVTGQASTKVGSWTNSGVYGGAKVTSSITPGDTATIVVTGTVVYLCMVQQVNNTATYSVSIDGINKGSYAVAAGATTTYLGRAYGPCLLRLGGLFAGPHTVVVTVTAASAANPVYLVFAASNGGPNSAIVVTENVIRQTATGYATWGGSDANVVAYNATILANYTTLAGDGLAVQHADAWSRIVPATDLISDGIHPNDLGHSHVEAAFLAPSSLSQSGATALLAAA